MFILFLKKIIIIPPLPPYRKILGIHIRQLHCGGIVVKMCLRAAALFIAIVSLIHQNVQSSDDKPVYFSLIASRGENGFNSSGSIPAREIALERINNETVLLGYNLTHEAARNSKVLYIRYNYKLSTYYNSFNEY